MTHRRTLRWIVPLFIIVAVASLAPAPAPAHAVSDRPIMAFYYPWARCAGRRPAPTPDPPTKVAGRPQAPATRLQPPATLHMPWPLITRPQPLP
ncbi:hypothetical protein K2Z83_01910 [Oscillochloris sp. ZM17-4]|uniref:hypothetical protein n=1 Tax=Oscillochloris sp. ZM17-4 TaxID=2866714 RepID=UPI001C737D6B|nr:hypothetical protein [Oscillochloris sp. ZM17-4]MBX0326449.1 hypothetical protein [Oscillochloris sp. ZM17-4]